MKRILVALLLTTCALAQMPENPTGPAIPASAADAVTGASALPIGSLNVIPMVTAAGTLGPSLLSNVATIPPPTGLALTVMGTPGATKYTYAVAAMTALGRGLLSAHVSVTTGNATLSAANYIRLAWNAVPGAVGYAVYQLELSGYGLSMPDAALLTIVTAVSYDDIEGYPYDSRPFESLDFSSGLQVLNAKIDNHLVVGAPMSDDSMPLENVAIKGYIESTSDSSIEGATFEVLVHSTGGAPTKRYGTGISAYATQDWESTEDNLAKLLGIDAEAANLSDKSVTRVRAGLFNALTTGPGDSVDGAVAIPSFLGDGAIATAKGIWAYPAQNYGTHVITNSYGVLVESPVNSGGGTVANNYGLYIKDQSSVGSTRAENIRSAGAGSTNVFEGKVTVETPGGNVSTCKTYTVASTNAAFIVASTTATVLLETMPAKAIVTGVDVKHSAQFSDAGGAMTDVSVSVGSAGGGTTFYSAAWSIGEVTAVANTTLQDTALFKRYTAASEAMNATFLATARNFGDASATFLSGGSVDLGICWVVKQ